VPQAIARRTAAERNPATPDAWIARAVEVEAACELFGD